VAPVPTASPALVPPSASATVAAPAPVPTVLTGPVTRPTVGAGLNPARHYNLAATSDVWLKGDAPLRRNDAELRRRLIDALDTEVAVQRVPYEAGRFDRQPTVAVVFGVGDRPVQALVYRPDEGRVYVTEDGIAFAPPADLAGVVAPLITGSRHRKRGNPR
jgi:hypothetical protein